MKMSTEIETEVRIRLLERIANSIDKRFEHLESKLDSQFKWTVGIMITMFGGLIIAKLV
jgi:chaperonin cofactor prefoldin